MKDTQQFRVDRSRPDTDKRQFDTDELQLGTDKVHLGTDKPQFDTDKPYLTGQALWLQPPQPEIPKSDQRYVEEMTSSP